MTEKHNTQNQILQPIKFQHASTNQKVLSVFTDLKKSLQTKDLNLRTSFGTPAPFPSQVGLLG